MPNTALRLILSAFLMLSLVGGVSLFSTFKAAYAAESKLGKVTGLPIPRFVTLRSSKVNARTGPALRYPIQWVYKRDNLPVEVTAEFDAWRQIRDMDGSISWVHSSLLSGQRMGLIHNIDGEMETAPAYKKADSQSRRVLALENAALGEIKKCDMRYCQLDFKAYRGWVEKKNIWGIYPDEVIE